MENIYKEEEMHNNTSAQENAPGIEPDQVRDEIESANHETITAEVPEVISQTHESAESPVQEMSQENETPEPIHDNIPAEVPEIIAESPEISDIASEEPLQELLKMVEEAIHFPESRKMNVMVQKARNEFFRILDDERKEDKEKFFAIEGNEGKEYVAPYDAMVKDFNQAFKVFKTKRKDYIDDLNKQKDLNLQLKKEVLEKLKGLIDSAETQTSFTEIKKLQDEWKKIGPVPISDVENLWNSYNFYVNKFYDQFSLYSEFKDLDRKRNLTTKEELIGSIEKLAALADMNEAMRQVRIFQDEWRHIGPVPKENLDDVINRYRNAVVAIYEKKESQNEEYRKRREQNYDAKIEILEKIKEISAFHTEKVQEWMDKNVEMGGWIEKWRAIGTVPLDKKDNLKEQLSEAVKVFNKNKNDFFRDRKKEKVDNLKKKTELCERAEAILASDDLVGNKKEIIKLQEDWKKIGAVPPKFSDSIWKRFHGACDGFFTKMSEQFGARDKEQHENLAKKNAIIEKIEALSKEGNVENLEETVKGLQEEWDASGFVPFKHKDDIRKRYYKALGLLAGNTQTAGSGAPRGRFSKGNEMTSYKLMLESWIHDNDGGKRVDSERHRLQRDIKKLEDEVSTLENNMEFLSNSKTAEALKSNLESQINKIRAKIDELKEKIKIVKKIGSPA